MQRRFQSIAAQVAASLREEVLAGNAGALPSERELGERLQVSRRTVRKALAMLRGEGLVKTTARRTLVISATRKPNRAVQPPQVKLLLPEPLEQARPFTALWISHLAGLIREGGSGFEVISGEKYYGARASRSLANLTANHPADCWVIARSNRPLQQWFDDHRIPAVIAGSPHPGIRLPSVDSDHSALSHHAAGQFLRRGHTRVALFFEKIRHAGDAETEAAFTAGLADSGRAAPPLICRVERKPEAMIRELNRLLRLRHRPTGFLLCNAFSYLTAVTYLAAVGYNVPADFSLISQDEGPFLGHVYPAPARYLTNPRNFAVALNRSVRRVLEHDAPEGSKIRIMPDFITGGSMAAART